jgi:hypothetical protein
LPSVRPLFYARRLAWGGPLIRGETMVNGLFAKLENQDFFVEYVTDHFKTAPQQAVADFPCTHVLDSNRIIFAFGEYTQNVKSFSVLLDSNNPDHYKRSGAMLHALYKSRIITEIEYSDGEWGSIEQLKYEMAPLGLSHSFAEAMIKFPIFYSSFYNELMSFDLSYQLCAAYEAIPMDYDFNYLHNMCHYLRKNTDLTVDSLSMIFRSLMISRPLKI